MYRDPRLLRRALDHHAADAGLAEPLEQVLAQTQILMELLAIVLAGEPARIPGPVDAQAKTDRIDLLTHQFDSSAASARSRTMTVRLLNGFRSEEHTSELQSL